MFISESLLAKHTLCLRLYYPGKTFEVTCLSVIMFPIKCSFLEWRVIIIKEIYLS